MQIKLLVEGGNMQPGPAVSQQLGPAGINLGQVIKKVNEETASFKGLKVPVELDVDTASKAFNIKVFSPPVSELLKKEIGIEKGSGLHKKEKVANASIEQIIAVAKTKLPNMLANDLKAAVKTVVGTCVSLGVLIENKPAVEIEQEIDQGKYNQEISAEKTETDSEKRKALDAHFAGVTAEQEKLKKQEEAEAAKAEEEKAEAEKAAAEAGASSGTTAGAEGDKAKDEEPGAGDNKAKKK